MRDPEEKLLKVVHSVKTKDQAGVAFKYYKLWEKKYSQRMLDNSPGLAYVSGNCLGFLNGFLSGNQK
jgi:hypothetical protein